MKHTLFILALITATIQTFAQSPRIKLNQITKDSLPGSVLISSPTDSGMVYSRDLYISYGADTVLILGGDTLAATSSIISSVLSDGVTITGDGTTGSELAVDTNTVIATKQDLDLYYLDSNPDGYTSNTGTVTSVGATAGTGISISGSPITTSGTLTITNTAPDQTVSIAGGGINAVTGTYPSFTVTGTEVDGSVTNELQTISTSGAAGNITLSDGGGTLNLNVNDADASTTNEIQDISTTGAAGNISISSGSTLNLNVDDADASASNELQTLSYNSGTNEITLSDGGGTEDLSNLDLVDSTRINATGDTAYYYQNGTLIGTGAIAGGGGGTTYNNITETADTLYITDYLDVDTSTLYVDASTNRVGIGTSTPQGPLSVVGGMHLLDDYQTSGNYNHIYSYKDTDAGSSIGTTDAEFAFFVAKKGSGSTVHGPYFTMRGNDYTRNANQKGAILFAAGSITSPTGNDGIIDFTSPSSVIKFNTGASFTNRFQIDHSGNIGVTADADYFHTAYSDIRLKDNISTINNGIDVINKIRPVTYKWKDGYLPNFDNEYGFIAQELIEAIPEAVSVTDNIIDIDGYEIHNLLNIKERFILPFTVKAIQEQQAIIEQQANEIDQLKALITGLNNRLTIIENK